MQQQDGGLWRRLRDQSPARQALLMIAPVVVIALLVLGGLIVWSVAAPLARPRPTAVAQAAPTPEPAARATQPASQASQAPTAETATPVPTPASLPTVLVPGREATATPPLPPTSTPTPAPTATPTPVPARSARIVNTEGQGANMRRAPSVSAQRVKVVVEGTIVELTGSEQRGDGYTWRTVRDVDGAEGYVIVDYLQPIQGPPGATAVLPPPTIRVDDITSPAKRGGEASLKIITRPGVRCELLVLIYGPDTLPTEGLEPKTADGSGVCSWTWTVPENVVPGVWRYRIVAGEGEGRAVREVQVVIT